MKKKKIVTYSSIKKQEKGFLLVIFIIVVLGITPFSYASTVASSMEEFWKGLGGSVNNTGATAYQGQAAGYYSLGNIYARTPVTHKQLMQVQLPNARAGCGGINVFKGAFSYINAGQIVETLKEIANNSAGFALQLAMDQISPVIAEKVEELQGWMQKINGMSVNSCETAAALVGGLWPKQDRASASICASMGSTSGMFNDYAASKHGCGNEGKYAKTREKNTAKFGEEVVADDVNIAWKALRDGGFLGVGDKFDKELAELFMTLSGTIIIRAPKNEESVPEIEYIASKEAHTDILRTMMEGGDVKTHACSETDKDKCLTLTQNGKTQTISIDNAFKRKVEKMMESMMDKIRQDKELDDTEKAFLTKISIPLYKTLNVYVAYSGAGNFFELPVYAEAIALQLLYDYLNDVLRQVEESTNRLMLACDDQLERFKKQIRGARMAIRGLEQKTHQATSTLIQLVDRTQMIEGILTRQMGRPVSSALGWTRGH